MTKVKPINADIHKLGEIRELIPEDRKVIADDLIKEIFFMAETLEKLKESIREIGAVELFEQGKQKFMRENPALKSYNTTIQRYGAIYKQLTDLIPKTDNRVDKDDGFDEFVSDRE